jgi:hypothetical protein
VEEPCLGPKYRDFMQNRFARTYPGYLFGTLLGAPLWFSRYYGDGSGGLFAQSLAASLTLLTTTQCYQVGGQPVDPPGWTICALMVFWALFPWSARRAKAMTTAQLGDWAVGHYYAQLALPFAVFGLLLPVLGYSPGFVLATTVPWACYPCFLMGVYAGELFLRHADAPLPWPERELVFFLRLWPTAVMDAAGSAGTLVDDDGGARERARWSDLVDQAALVLLVVALATAGASAGLFYTDTAGGSALGSLWLQALAPFLQTTVVVALTRDDARCGPPDAGRPVPP